MKKNAYWVISRDVETKELKFSKRFHVRAEAREYPLFQGVARPVGEREDYALLNTSPLRTSCKFLLKAFDFMAHLAY
jgi:hypothetical protein